MLHAWGKDTPSSWRRATALLAGWRSTGWMFAVATATCMHGHTCAVAVASCDVTGLRALLCEPALRASVGDCLARPESCTDHSHFTPCICCSHHSPWRASSHTAYTATRCACRAAARTHASRPASHGAAAILICPQRWQQRARRGASGSSDRPRQCRSSRSGRLCAWRWRQRWRRRRHRRRLGRVWGGAGRRIAAEGELRAPCVRQCEHCSSHGPVFPSPRNHRGGRIVFSKTHRTP